jgi:hypothetical protein
MAQVAIFGSSLALMAYSPAAAATPSQLVYNAREDFLVAPDQANPSLPWSYRHAGRHTPLLAKFSTDHFGVEGLETWHGDQVSTSENDMLPWVGVNSTGEDLHPLGINWPAGALLVHPGFTRAVVIRCQSPHAGSIFVRAALIDRDESCGDGVSCAIRLAGQSAIARGVFPNGGSAIVRSGWYQVQEGSLLDLRVGVGPNGDNQCDSTQVRLRILLQPD